MRERKECWKMQNKRGSFPLQVMRLQAGKVLRLCLRDCVTLRSIYFHCWGEGLRDAQRTMLESRALEKGIGTLSRLQSSGRVLHCLDSR